MASKAAKYGARTVAVGGLTLAAVTWATARNLKDQGAALCAAGLAFLVCAPTLPPEWRGLMYALGAVLLIAGVGIILVDLNAMERAALGAGVHDGRTAPPSKSQNQNQQFFPRARLEVLQHGVYMDGVPDAVTPQEAAMILGESLERGAVVEVDMTFGIVDIWPELQSELSQYGFNPIKTIRKPEDR